MFNVWIGRVSSDNGDGAWVFIETSYNRALDRLAQHCRDNWGELTENWFFQNDKEDDDIQSPGYANKTSDDIVRIYYDTITWEHFDIERCPITTEMLAAIPGSIVVGDSVVLTPSTD